MADHCGLRVLRGPDWTDGDRDGGEGYLGTVIQLLGDHFVRVLWDMGQESTYSAGHDGKFELKVFDSAPVGELRNLEHHASLVILHFCFKQADKKSFTLTN